MRRARHVNPPDPLKWQRDERDSLVRQIERLNSGQVRSRQHVDGLLTDTTGATVEALQARLAKLELFLAPKS